MRALEQRRPKYPSYPAYEKKKEKGKWERGRREGVGCRAAGTLARKYSVTSTTSDRRSPPRRAACPVSGYCLRIIQDQNNCNNNNNKMKKKKKPTGISGKKKPCNVNLNIYNYLYLYIYIYI